MKQADSHSDLVDLTPSGDPASAYSQVLRWAEAAGHGEALRDFLFAVQAPPNLRGFLLLADHALEGLRLAKDKWRDFDEDTRVHAWIMALEWVKAHRTQLSRIGRHVHAISMSRHGFRRHAVYAAILYKTVPSRSERYRLLQAHLLLAQAVCLRLYGKSAEGYEAYSGKQGFLDAFAMPWPAAFVVRLASRPLGYLSEELEVGFEPEAFFESLPAEVSGRHSVYYRDLLLFFEKAYGTRAQIKRGLRIIGPRRNGGPLWTKEDLNLGELAEESLPGFKVAAYSRHLPISPKEREEMDLTDDDPDEAEEDDESGTLAVVDSKEKDPAKQSLPLTRAAMRHVARSNQRFWWAYPNLIHQELAPIFKEARQKFLERWQAGARDRRIVEELELFALLDVMLWTSSTIERAIDLRIIDAEEDMIGDLALLPCKDGPMATWLVSPPLPERKAVMVRNDLDRECTDRVPLPDVASASQLVFELAAIRRPEANGRLFTNAQSWYERRIRRIIDTQCLAPRVTPLRIGKYLFEQLYRRSNQDLIASVLVTGHQLPSARARLHYVCRSVEQLQRLYSETVCEEASRLGYICLPSPKIVASCLFVANDPCPKTETIAKRVKRLQELIQFYHRRQGYDPVARRRFHNVFTLYVLWMFAYATGIRGIGTPYLQLADYDRQTGIARLVDKDRGGGTHSKLLWLPEFVVRQMELYDDYIRAEFPDADLPCFFKLDDDCNVPVRPSTQRWLMDQEYMRMPGEESFFNYRINIHRRYMINELANAGAQLTDWWAGHWNLGEAPWQPASSYYITEARSLLKAYLVPVLERLGFYTINPSYVRLRRNRWVR